MNDNDVREMFRRREADVAAQAPPRKVVRRIRRRQVGTVFVATAIGLALVFLPLAGLRLVGDRADRGPTPGGSGSVELPAASEGFRSAALPYASMTYPDGWYLMDTSPLGWMGIEQPAPIISGPVLQLANLDPDLRTAPRCMVADEPLPASAVLLTVGIQAEPDTSVPRPTQPWPASFEPLPVDTDPMCTLGETVVASWVAPSGVAYWANLLIGPEASAADRAAVQTAFESLTFPPSTAPQMTGMFASQGQGSPRLVLDSAFVVGVTFTLVAYIEQGRVPWIGISSSDPMRDGGALSVGTGSASEGPVSTTMTGWATGAVVWGTVGAEVARAEISTQEARTFPATILDMPDDIAGGRRAVWGFVDGSTGYAQAVGYDDAGNVLGNPTIATEPPEVIASGDDPLAGHWEASITHDTVGVGMTLMTANGGGGWCCLEGDRLHGADLALTGTGSGSDGPSNIEAFASTRVDRVVAVFADGNRQEGQLFPFPARYIGPAQYVLLFIPHGVELRGELIAYGTTDQELARIPFLLEP